jgi:hypothetical protein
MDFFTSNCKDFNDEEENKHSYMDTYEKYVKLIDETIDAQLQQKFSKDEISNFYKDFKQDYAHYKELNYDTVDVLNNSIDFDQFKETMLKFKIGVENKEKEGDKKNLGDSNFDEFFNLMKE